MRPFLVAALLVMLALAGCMGGARPQSNGSGVVLAAFDVAPDLPAAKEPVTFIDRSNGSIATWVWDFGDGDSSEEQNPVHAFQGPGTYDVTLRVEDEKGNEDQTVKQLVVGEIGSPAPGGFKVDFVYTVVGRNVEFEPLLTPADAIIDQYFWDFGDGGTSRDSAPDHAYASEGLFVVSLRASSQAKISEARHGVPVGVGTGEPGALASRAHVVIALIDTGVNPYHSEFLDAAYAQHPASFIEGYPAETEALELTLDATSYGAAVKADEEVWEGVKGGTLYWIPGTRIVGAISAEQDGAHKILDDNGHGSATASDAAGATVGSCPKCLIVIIEGFGDDGLQWALDQDWIDVVSNSWSSCIATCDVNTGVVPPFLFPAYTRSAVEGGKEVVFASGNGMLNAFDAPYTTYLNSYSGPDWILTVGAADASSGATVVGTGRPFDVMSYGLDWRGAAHQSTTSIAGFSGTSAAAPIVAGAYGYVVRELRELVGDTTEGPRSGVVAQGLDASFTRAEVERALLLTALVPSGVGPVVPTTLPGSAASFLYSGYGLVNAETAAEALAVVLGEQPAPERPNEDEWAAVDSEIRQAIWGSYDPGIDAVGSEPDPADVAAFASYFGVEARPYSEQTGT